MDHHIRWLQVTTKRSEKVMGIVVITAILLACNEGMIKLLCNRFKILIITSWYPAHAALANFCKINPSECAYNFGSVQTDESTSANCRSYPPGFELGIFTNQFNGTQLKLAGSNLGSEQYISSDYYEWPASTATQQLLFSSLTRINLTTITLHYYITVTVAKVFLD